MKLNKSLLAVAIAGITSTSVLASELYNDGTSSIEMGGRAEARMSVMDGEVEDRSRIRLNFTGKSQITDNVYGIGFYEGEFTTNEAGQGTDAGDSDLTNRYAYAGIGSQFGELTYGKNDGALGVITDFTDIMAYHGNSAAYKIAVADRSDNMMSYKGEFGNLQLKGSYRFADRIEGSNGEFDNNDTDGYSLSAIYALDLNDVSLSFGIGYADGTEISERPLQRNTITERDQLIAAASAAYKDFYFAAAYVDGTDDIVNSTDKYDLSGYEVAAAYTWNKAVFTASYNFLEEKDKSDGKKSDIADNFAIDATYYFQPNFRGYVSYNFNNLSESDVDHKWQTEDELALGLRYDF